MRAPAQALAALSPRKRAANPEYHLTVQVAGFLRVAMPDGLLWSHFPAGEVRSERAGGRLKAMGLQRGWPDFVFMLPHGKLGGIELKAGSGKPTPEQLAWGERATAASGYFAICRSVDEVEATLISWLTPFGCRLKARVAA